MVLHIMYVFDIPDRFVLWAVLNWLILRKVIRSKLAEEAPEEVEGQETEKPGMMARMKSIISRLSSRGASKKKIKSE